jgi:ElaB/YqjD/DUF883 family membrane-anchored ribosome-binding protein
MGDGNDEDALATRIRACIREIPELIEKLPRGDANDKRAFELERHQNKLAARLREIIEKNIRNDTEEYEKAISALDKANNRLREAKKSLNDTADAIDKVAQAIEWIAKAAKYIAV